MAFDFEMKRRGLLVAGLALAGFPVLAQRFQPPQDITPLLMKITGGVVADKRGVEVVLPQIAENGNSVPLNVKVASPMTEVDFVAAIHVFAERNPRPLVASFHLGPQSGRAEISTRVRLAGTQTVNVLVELSGKRFLLGSAYVLVTAAACLDESLL